MKRQEKEEEEGEEEEEEEGEEATQLAACGDIKQKERLEKCNVNQNKQIVSQ